MVDKRKFLLGTAGSLVIGSLLLTGCSSNEGSTSTVADVPSAGAYPSAVLPSAEPSANPVEETTSVVAPVMVAEGQELAQGPVGNYIVFNVASPEDWDIVSNNPEIVEVKNGGQEGTAVMNPGGLLKMIGKTKVVLTNTKTKKDWVVEVRVIEPAPVLAEPGIAPPPPPSGMPMNPATPETAPSTEVSPSTPAS